MWLDQPTAMLVSVPFLLRGPMPLLARRPFTLARNWAAMSPEVEVGVAPAFEDSSTMAAGTEQARATGTARSRNGRSRGGIRHVTATDLRHQFGRIARMVRILPGQWGDVSAGGPPWGSARARPRRLSVVGIDDAITDGPAVRLFSGASCRTARHHPPENAVGAPVAWRGGDGAAPPTGRAHGPPPAGPTGRHRPGCDWVDRAGWPGTRGRRRC